MIRSAAPLAYNSADTGNFDVTSRVLSTTNQGDWEGNQMRRRLIISGAAAALLAACGGSSAQGVSFGPANQGGTAHGTTGTGTTGTGTPDGSATQAVDYGKPVGLIERHVDARFTVDHNQFLSAFNAVIRRATSLGGFVTDSTTQSDSDGRIDSGSVTMRIPADRLSEFVDGMPSSLSVSGIDFSSVDHTADSLDLQAELAAAQAHRDALVALLRNANTIADITSLDSQVADVQREIDRIQGQQNQVTSQVTMATARVQISERGAVAPPPPSGPNRVLDALSSGWSNAVAVLSGAVLVVATVLPFLLVLLLAWVTRARWLRLLGPARRG